MHTCDSKDSLDFVLYCESWCCHTSAAALLAESKLPCCSRSRCAQFRCCLVSAHMTAAWSMHSMCLQSCRGTAFFLVITGTRANRRGECVLIVLFGAAVRCVYGSTRLKVMRRQFDGEVSCKTMCYWARQMAWPICLACWLCGVTVRQMSRGQDCAVPFLVCFLFPGFSVGVCARFLLTFDRHTSSGAKPE
jgi:hypothetical protein